MFTRLFRFRGRMSRSDYLLANVKVVGLAALIVLGYLASAFAASAAFPEAAAHRPMAYATAALLVFVMGWIGLAINAQRVRDAGLNPWLVVGALAAFSVFDISVLGGYLEQRFFWPLAHQTVVGGVILTAAWIAMLTWPSAPAATAEAASVARKTRQPEAA